MKFAKVRSFNEERSRNSLLPQSRLLFMFLVENLIADVPSGPKSDCAFWPSLSIEFLQGDLSLINFIVNKNLCVWYLNNDEMFLKIYFYCNVVVLYCHLIKNYLNYSLSNILNFYEHFIDWNKFLSIRKIVFLLECDSIMMWKDRVNFTLSKFDGNRVWDSPDFRKVVRISAGFFSFLIWWF